MGLPCCPEPTASPLPGSLGLPAGTGWGGKSSISPLQVPTDPHSNTRLHRIKSTMDGGGSRWARDAELVAPSPLERECVCLRPPLVARDGDSARSCAHPCPGRTSAPGEVTHAGPARKGSTEGPWGRRTLLALIAQGPACPDMYPVGSRMLVPLSTP